MFKAVSSGLLVLSHHATYEYTYVYTYVYSYVYSYVRVAVSELVSDDINLEQTTRIPFSGGYSYSYDDAHVP